MLIFPYLNVLSVDYLLYIYSKSSPVDPFYNEGTASREKNRKVDAEHGDWIDWDIKSVTSL